MKKYVKMLLVGAIFSSTLFSMQVMASSTPPLTACTGTYESTNYGGLCLESGGQCGYFCSSGTSSAEVTATSPSSCSKCCICVPSS